MNTRKIAVVGTMVFLVVTLAFSLGAAAEPEVSANGNAAARAVGQEEGNATAALDMNSGIIALSVGMVMSIAALATGMAQKEIGAAAVGAVAENPKLVGAGITLMVLPETIVVFGFAIAFLLLDKI